MTPGGDEPRAEPWRTVADEYHPPISAVISGGRCITFWRELLSRMEVSGAEIVGVKGSVAGLRRVSRCGRSAAGWVGRRRRSEPMSCRRGGSGRSLLGSGRRSVCRLRSVRRSLVELLLVCRCAVLPAGWGRAASTVSREVAANGGRLGYRASVAHTASRASSSPAEPAKLTMNPRLRAVVEAKLNEWWSPTQISSWLVDAYPGDEEMRVSHETIYQSLFVQGRGALRKELWRCLRTGRAACDAPKAVERRRRARSVTWS